MGENPTDLPPWLESLTRPVWGYVTNALLIVMALGFVSLAQDSPLRFFGWLVLVLAVAALVLEVVASRLRRRRTAARAERTPEGETP
jgi:peptidoglycan/LPS O-acetylase OafA/YrhL